MTKRFWRIAGWSTLVVLVVAGLLAYKTLLGKPFTLNMLANRQAVEFLIRDPELFTQIGAIDGTFLDQHSDRLAPVGVAKRDQDFQQLARFIGEVKQFDRSRLARQDQLTYDILLDFYGDQLALQRFDWLSSEPLYPIAPMFGIQDGLPGFLANSHVIKNKRSARNYVLRLEASAAKLDGATAEMVRQSGLGVVLPISLVVRAQSEIEATIKPAPADNPLVTSFALRMDKVASLDAAFKDDLKKKAIEAVRSGIYPAYQRMSAALELQKPAALHQTAGVDRLPDGAAFYAAMLRINTTTDYTPEQLHALGLSEVARIDREMDALLKSQGLSEGSVAQRMQALEKDPRFLLPDTDEGRAQVLARYQQILDEVNARMGEYFPTLPKGHLSVVRVPEAAEKGSAAAYYEAEAMDGSRPGQFFVNLRDTSETPVFEMKTTAYHEGIPGHHFQISTALALKDLPLIRQQTIFTAYAEGWALYAERFAAEIGMYKDDPYGDLGRLQDEMLRAVRLVVDTGLHAQGWSREQAISYMVGTTGMAEPNVVTEVERYMSLPGQACAYKVGQLKILALRDHAKAELGERFNIKEFHGVILGSGSMPLYLMDKLVDDWIVTVKARP